MRNSIKECGFTLVEVMAALLIFSTAILGLMSAGMQNIRIMNKIEQKQVAGIVADNQLILLQNDGRPFRVGYQKGSTEMGGRDWLWQIRTEKTGQRGFYKLTADVGLRDDAPSIVTRTAFIHRNDSGTQ